MAVRPRAVLGEPFRSFCVTTRLSLGVTEKVYGECTPTVSEAVGEDRGTGKTSVEVYVTRIGTV